MVEDPLPPEFSTDSPTIASSRPATPPAAIGPYHIVRRIGEGGMGIVYEAEQEQPIRRRVAVKLIKGGLDTAQFVARFETERQALALMDHPNIARVLDAGATADARPYFVMEFVEGAPITHYCDRERMEIDRRLELFVAVCEAVQHAHQKGIIHRDLKPSNILVTVTDGAPSPKVIDFGVAKATSPTFAAPAPYTEVGRPLGTLEYMSPEQAEMSGLDIDTRTDIYSLGVVLYELLTGALPFPADELRRLPNVELQHRLREVEPPRPSRRLSTADGAATELARRRRTDPRALSRTLAHDLDWIVLRAMEKDRTRRYPTASELAQDVRRFMRHEPVVARPPSAAYRLTKFVRRHRLGVVTASAVTVALVLGLAGTIAGLVETRRAERRAEEEATTARRVTDFLVGLFKVSDPGEARGDTITAREILDEGVARIDRELEAEPRIRARLQRTMGGVYRNLGLYPKAESLLEQALATQRATPSDDRSSLPGVLLDLGWLRHLQGRFNDAISLDKEAVTLLDAAGPLDEPLLGQALLQQGMALRETGNYIDAQAALERSLEIRERLFGPDHRDVSFTLYNLGWLHKQKGEYQEARRIYERVVAIMERTLPPLHPSLAWAISDLALINADLGDYERAKVLLERALEIRLKGLPPNHPDIAASYNNLGAQLWREKRFDDALAAYERALAIRQAALPPDHPNIAQALGNIGLVYQANGQFAEALDYLERALAIDEKAFGPRHPRVASTLSNLAVVLASVGDLDAASRRLERAIGIEEEALGPNNPAIADALDMRAKIHRARGDEAAAQRDDERAAAIRARARRTADPAR